MKGFLAGLRIIFDGHLINPFPKGPCGLEVGDEVVVEGQDNIRNYHDKEKGVVINTCPNHPFASVRVDFENSAAVFIRTFDHEVKGRIYKVLN